MAQISFPVINMPKYHFNVYLNKSFVKNKRNYSSWITLKIIIKKAWKIDQQA